MSMNNNKIGGRISEIDIVRFVLERLNDNSQGVKFKMGLGDNLLWYKPMNELSKLINKEYIYDPDTYETKEMDFIPTLIIVNDLGVGSNLDFILGSASVTVVTKIEINDPMTSELHRLLIEELRDTLRQGFYVNNIPQRAYKDINASPTYKQFKFQTTTGTITPSGDIDTINSKQFIDMEFDIDIEFSDLAIYGNEYLIEMCVKNSDDTYSNYERIYPVSISFGVSYTTKDKQELFPVIDKFLVNSNETSYDQSYFKYESSVAFNLLDLSKYPIGSVIKYNTEYKKVSSNTTTPFQEQKSWETHSQYQSKGFGINLSLIHREQHPFETIDIISRLYDDLVKKYFSYNIYKMRVRKYKLQTNGTWELQYTLFERNILMVSNETAIELGQIQPIQIPFVVSDIE